MSGIAAPRCPRYQSLDVWRGVACLMVVVYHATFYAAPAAPRDDAWPWLSLARLGWIGVPIFFVISGYCITATADRSRHRGFAIGDYAWRRFRRIFPPYWIFLAFAVVVVGLGDVLVPQLFTDEIDPIPRPHWRSAWQWFGNLTLTETWRHHVIGDARGFFISPAWTLCYEEQFYFVTGLLLWLGRAHFFRWAGVVTALVAAVAVLTHTAGIDVRGFFFDGRWLLFAAGILVYHVVNYGRRSAPWLAGASFAGFAALATFGKRQLHALVGYDIDHDLQVGACFALVALALHGVDRRMFAAPLLWPLRLCGQMCYSLYLIHWPVTKAVSHVLAWNGFTGHVETLLVVVPACIATSVALAWPFHRFVEMRFLNSPVTAASPGIPELGRHTQGVDGSS